MSTHDQKIVELIELLFFAYRDFVSDPDEILRGYGFGRAHHRIIHFVGRNPGIRVAELLDILRITKQSLGRVLKDLVESGHVVQREGDSDRRHRLLYLTAKGEDLRERLMQPQIERFASALDASGGDASSVYRDVLLNLVNEKDRAEVENRISRARRPVVVD
ncbi:MAG: MarR family transcriptional regulator [Pseudomonadota bacterium]